MAIWSNLLKPSIYRRVLAGFAIILSFILVVVVVNYLQLGRFRDLTAQALPASRNMAVVQDYALALASLDSNLERFTVISGDEVRDAITSDLEQMKASVATIREKASPADLPSLDVLDRETRSLEAEAGRFMSLQPGISPARDINQQTLNVFKGIDTARQLNNQLTQEVLNQVQGIILNQENLVSDIVSSVLSLAVIALVVAIIASVLVSRSLVRPLSNILKTAALLAEGKLDTRVKVESRDETGQLALAFNSMADQLQAFIAGLEGRVAERTRDLATTIEVGKLATSIYSRQELLPRLVEFIRAKFGLYYTQIYLLDEAGRYANLSAGTGAVGEQLLSRQHRLDMSETSLVARAVQSGQTVLVADTTTSSIHKANDLLPDTRSEMTIPLMVGNTIIGVLDMQADTVGTFNMDNLPVFEAMASQIASVLRGSQAFDEAQTAVQRAEALNQRLTADTWQSYLGQLESGQALGYQYDLEAPRPLDTGIQANGDTPHVVQPVVLRGQTIGSLVIHEDREREWKPEELLLVEDVAKRVAQALDQYRAFDQIKQAEAEVSKRAAELQTVAEVSAATASILNLDELLQRVSDLTKERFRLYHAHIYLLDEAGQNLMLAAGAGEIGRMMRMEGRRISFNHPNSLVARAARTRQGVIANDVAQAPDFLPNPLLPETKAEIAVPMIVGDELIGVLDVQANRVNHFSQEDVRVQRTLADQVAIAVQNARIFAKANQQATVLEASNDFISLADLNGNLIYMNPGGARMIGYDSPNLFIGKSISDVHLPEDFERVNTNAVPAAMQTGYWRGENGLLHRDGHRIPVDQAIFVIRNAAGEITNIATIMTDITERKAQEEALRLNEERFRSLVSNVPGAIYRSLLDEHWTMAFISDNVTSLTGYPASDFLNNSVRTYSSIIHPDDVAFVDATISKAVREKKPYSLEYRIVHASGDIQWVSEEGQAAYDADTGEPLWLDGALFDVTERVLAQQQLQENEARLSEAVQMARMAYWEFDYATEKFTFTDQSYEMVGTSIDIEGTYEVSAADNAQKFIHPDDVLLVNTVIQEAFETTDPTFTREIELRLIKADGSIVTATARMRAVKDEHGRTVKLVGANQDITERKAQEEALRQSEAQLSEAIQIAQMGYWELDTATMKFTFNDQFYALLGTTAEAEGGYEMDAATYATKFVHPDDAAIVGANAQVAVETTASNWSDELEARSIRADGQQIDFLVRMHAVKDEHGRTVKIVGANQDITQRKAQEAALRQNEAQLSEAIQIARLGYWEFDFDTQLFYFNDQFYSMLGTTAEAEGGYTMDPMTYATRYVHPDDAAAVGANVQIARETTDPNWSDEFEARSIRADGQQIYFLVRMHVVKDAQGRTIKLIGANQDITERKAQEAALVENERRYRQILDGVTDMILVKGEKSRIVWANKAFREYYGMSNEDLQGMIDAPFQEPDHTQQYVLDDLRVWETGQPLSIPEEPVTRYDGETRLFETLKTPIFDEHGNVFLTVGVSRDITERKMAELERERFMAEAQRNAQLIRTVIDATPDWIFAKDRDYRYVLANQGYATAIGTTTEDIVGKTDIDLGFPEEIVFGNPEKGIRGFRTDDRAVLESGESIYNPYDPATFADGSLHVFDTQKMPLRDADGNVFASLGFARDVTIRQQQEEEIRLAREEAEILYQVSAAINEAKDPHTIVEAIQRLVAPKEAMAVTLSAYPTGDYTTSRTIRILSAWTRSGMSSEVLEFPLEDFTRGMMRDPNTISHIDDITTDPTLSDTVREAYRAYGITGILSIPMFLNGKLAASLSVQTDEPYHFTDRDTRIFRAIAEQAAAALERMNLIQETQKRAAEMETVARVSAATTTLLDTDELLTSVCNLTKDSFGLYHVHIYLLDETDTNLVLSAGAGEAGQIMKAEGRTIAVSHPNSIVARAAREEHGVIANDVSADPHFLPNILLPLTQSEMAVPMIVAGKLIGVLDVQASEVNRFTDEDVRVQTTLADQVAIAIQNARAYKVQQEVADRLREVDRMKSQFLANMSHELRTPLNSIIGYAEVLLDGIDGDLSDEAIEDVQAIHGGGKHLLSIINDILDLAKIDAGQMYMDRRETDLAKIVDEVVHTCQILVKDKGIALEFEQPADFPTVYGDPVRLRQIIYNLVNNAIKFTEQGGVTISLSQNDKREISVTVKDTGIGMSDKDLSVIFERFRQVDGSATRRAGGTGLGLAITRQLVQMHDGDIHVASEVGKGSTFWFTLPVFEQQTA